MVAAPTLKAGPIRVSQPAATIVPITIRVARQLDQRPGEVFRAYADIDERAQWYPPPNEAIEFESHDFRAGGNDRFRGGSKDTKEFVASTSYQHIVDSRCIVFVEQVTSTAGRLLAVSLVAWTMAPSGAGTLLNIADQTTSIVGSSPVESGRYSYELVLDRLSQHLAISHSS